MKYLITLFLSCFASQAFAVEYSLLDVRKISVEEYRIRNHRSPYWDYIPQETGEQWTSGGAFNLNLDLARIEWFRLYVDNRLHMESTESQLRSAGWEFKAGMNLANRLNVYWHHHSQHLLDSTPDAYKRNYPLWDSYNVEIIILQH